MNKNNSNRIANITTEIPDETIRRLDDLMYMLDAVMYDGAGKEILEEISKLLEPYVKETINEE